MDEYLGARRLAILRAHAKARARRRRDRPLAARAVACAAAACTLSRAASMDRRYLTSSTGTSERFITLFATEPIHLDGVPMAITSQPAFFACFTIVSAGSPTRMRAS